MADGEANGERGGFELVLVGQLDNWTVGSWTRLVGQLAVGQL